MTSTTQLLQDAAVELTKYQNALEQTDKTNDILEGRAELAYLNAVLQQELSKEKTQ